MLPGKHGKIKQKSFDSPVKNLNLVIYYILEQKHSLVCFYINYKYEHLLDEVDYILNFLQTKHFFNFYAY